MSSIIEKRLKESKKKPVKPPPAPTPIPVLDKERMGDKWNKEAELAELKKRVDELKAIRQLKDDNIAMLEAELAETDDRVIALEAAVREAAKRCNSIIGADWYQNSELLEISTDLRAALGEGGEHG